MIPASSVLEAISAASVEAAFDWLQDNYGEEFGTPKMPPSYVEECRERFSYALCRALDEGADLCAELPTPAEYVKDIDHTARVDAAMGER